MLEKIIEGDFRTKHVHSGLGRTARSGLSIQRVQNKYQTAWGLSLWRFACSVPYHQKHVQ